MEKKIKLLLVIPTLSGGGAERQFSYLLKYLERSKFKLSLCLWEDKISYEIPDDVTIYRLNRKGIWDLFKLIYKLRKIIRYERPDIVLSTIANSNIVSYLAKRFSGINVKLILRETIDPIIYVHRGKFGRGKLLFSGVKMIYPLADKIIAPSKGIEAALQKEIPKIPSKNLKCIYNMVDLENALTLSNENLDHQILNNKEPIIISVGRLIERKGFKYLLYAFEKVNKKIASQLLILGDGPERNRLKRLACSLGIDERTLFLGFQSNPFKFISKAKILVLPSLVEGFANVLIEAMAVGTPVISTNAPYGTDEIIENGKSGFLVPIGNIDALAEKILLLLSNSQLHTKFIEEGRKIVQERFSHQKQIKKWEDLLLEVALS